MFSMNTEIITFAVGFPYRYYQYSPTWFIHWPYDVVAGIVVIGMVAWLLSRAMQGKMTPRQSLLLIVLSFFTLGFMIINSLLIVAEI